ncbi:hypothetical protein BH09ACT10_BH09ACT10_00020 [soil metagenome]
MELPITPLPMLDTGSDGCCCGTAASPTTPGRPTASRGTDTTTQTYSVAGMTCSHCKQTVVNQLRTLDGVAEVTVDLVAGGTSSVAIISAKPLDDAQVVEALNKAGNYQLA